MSFHVSPELAYIGPGAGFAFLGSFLTLLGGLLLGVVSVLLWPFRLAWRKTSALNTTGNGTLTPANVTWLEYQTVMGDSP